MPLTSKRDCGPKCGPSCIRCWRNKLKHQSKTAKQWLKKNDKVVGQWNVDYPEEIDKEKKNDNANSRKRVIKVVNNGLTDNYFNNSESESICEN